MSVLFSIVAGWTGLLGPFTLKLAGVAFNLSGYTVELVLHTPMGASVPAGGTVSVLNQGTFPGQVTYAPVAGDFTFSSSGNLNPQRYKLHWKVTDGLGKVVYFPNVDGDEISVYPQ